MDLSKKSEEKLEGNFKIVDTTGVLVLTVTSVVSYIIAASLIAAILLEKSHVTMEMIGITITISLLFIPINCLLMYRLLAIWNGVQFDLETRKLSFPGGGLAANDLLDYVRPSFFMQYLKRITIDLEDILQIGMEKRWVKTIESWVGGGKFKDKEKLVGILTITGNFGTAEIKFKSIPKGNQVYSALSYYLELGEPVVIRN